MGTIITIAIISFGMGLLPAFMASQKGRRFVVWWVYGALLFPVAIIHALFIGASFKRGTKNCGY